MSLSRLSRRSAALTTTLLLSAIAVCAAPAAADEFWSEDHELNYVLDNPAWNSVNTYTVELPLFDTREGDRTLIGYNFGLTMGSNYTMSVDANPTANNVGCQVSWTKQWSASLNGNLFFPWDVAHPSFDQSQAFGAFRTPFAIDPIPPETYQSAIEFERPNDDQAVMDQLTGIGTASIDCTYTLSDLAVTAPMRWPTPTPGVFVPDLIYDVSVDNMFAYLTVSYFYTPEPSSLALMGLGFVALLRRRR